MTSIDHQNELLAQWLRELREPRCRCVNVLGLHFQASEESAMNPYRKRTWTPGTHAVYEWQDESDDDKLEDLAAEIRQYCNVDAYVCEDQVLVAGFRRMKASTQRMICEAVKEWQRKRLKKKQH